VQQLGTSATIRVFFEFHC